MPRNKRRKAMPRGEKYVVISVDRDDDLGRKTSFDGPIVGEKQCLKAAVALATSDPADTDANAFFDAVKTAKEGKYDVAILTGSEKTGVESDRIVAEQLGSVLKKGNYSGIIFVSDGADDEQLLPIIQSMTKVISVRKVVVKQAEQLENAYYSFLDFFKRVTKDKELSRLLFGVPGLAALMIAFFGESAWRLILGFVGLYLFIKGLKLESYLEGFFNDFKTSFKLMRISFFTYTLSVILFAIGLFQGLRGAAVSPDVVIGAASFVHESVLTFLIAGIMIPLGKAADAFPDYSTMLHHINSAVLLGVSAWVLKSASGYFLEPLIGFTNLVSAVMVGLIIVVVMGLLKKSMTRVYY